MDKKLVHKLKLSALEEENIIPIKNYYDAIMDVELEIIVTLGKTKAYIQELIDLNVGDVINLEKSIDEPSYIYIRGCEISQCEIVNLDRKLSVKIISSVENK